ncbi:MAG: hypothetical protein MUO81_09610 [Thermoplasmata archaeon]|nr:hypothetical protein [Thermoplasmata archaeon]
MSRLAYSSSASYRGGLGVLKIEGGNLIFVKRSGMVNPKDYVVQTIPIKAIRSMSVQGTMKRVLVVMVDSSMHSGIPRHEFSVTSPEQWIGAIQSEMKKVAEITQSPQPTYIKEVVREIVKYPCPYCNSLIEVTSSRCPICGAPQKK